MAGSITPKIVAATAVQTPDTGYVTIFTDIADGIPKYKDSLGVVHTFSSISITIGSLSDTDDSIRFNPSQFYLTQDTSGNPTINLVGGSVIIDHGGLTGLLDDDHPQYILVDGTRPFTGNQSMGGNRVTSLGAPVAASDAARLQDIQNVGPGFYGVVVKDNSVTVRVDSILFPSADFDVDSFGDGARVQLDSSVARKSDLAQAFYGVVVKDGTTTVRTDSVLFAGADFDVDSFGDGARVQLDASVARKADLVQAFYGIVVKDNAIAVRTDSVLFSGSDFDVDSFGDGARVQLDASVARKTDVGPGFYGITVGQFSNNPSYRGINTVKFNPASFYVTQNSPNTDEVQINFRGRSSVTIKDGVQTLVDDTVSFNKTDFYLTKDSQGHPEVNLRRDNLFSLSGHFVNIPSEPVMIEEYVPIQQTLLSFVGRTSRGSLAVVLRVRPDHQVKWTGAGTGGAFNKVYFYPIRSDYSASTFNVAQVGSSVQMDFYSISNDVKNFSWTLVGREQ